MPGPLAENVALVTGAARGIGRAIALKLAAAGCNVVVNYYNSHDEAAALCTEIHSLGQDAYAIKASVAMPESVDELFEELGKHFERLDIVVNNAASGVLKPALEMSLKHWRWCSETNAFALTLLAQRAVPMMSAGGRIIASVEPLALHAQCLDTDSSVPPRPRSSRSCARSPRSSARAASA